MGVPLRLRPGVTRSHLVDAPGIKLWKARSVSKLTWEGAWSIDATLNGWGWVLRKVDALQKTPGINRKTSPAVTARWKMAFRAPGRRSGNRFVTTVSSKGPPGGASRWTFIGEGLQGGRCAACSKPTKFAT